jgi:TRAP-type C4-dicarboxylate transport system permease small subunit
MKVAELSAGKNRTGFIEKISLTLVIISFVALALLMLWMTADVVLVLFGYPIPGTINYTEILNVVILFLPLAYVTARRSHIVVDIIQYTGKAKQITDFTADCSVFLYSVMFSWQLGIKAWKSLSTGEFDMIGIKVFVFPAKIALAIGAIGSALAALFLIVDRFRGEKRA